MAELLDTVNKQLSASIEFKRGMAAFLSASADNEQRALDACTTLAAERDEYKSKYEAEKQRADAAEKNVEYWKRLAQKPKIVFRDNSSLGTLVTGDSNETYAKDNSIQGQQPHRQIGVGQLECV